MLSRMIGARSIVFMFAIALCLVGQVAAQETALPQSQQECLQELQQLVEQLGPIVAKVGGAFNIDALMRQPSSYEDCLQKLQGGRAAMQFLQSTQPAAPGSPAPAAAPLNLPIRVPEGILNQILAFVYTSANWIGRAIVGVVERLIPLRAPAQLVDPIGYLALLTIFLVVAEVAKKLVWFVVIGGWILIIVRVAIEVLAK